MINRKREAELIAFGLKNLRKKTNAVEAQKWLFRRWIVNRRVYIEFAREMRCHKEHPLHVKYKLVKHKEKTMVPSMKKLADLPNEEVKNC